MRFAEKKVKWWKKLQPLRIPAGWTVMFNKLEDVEPETVEEGDAAWDFLFVQDIMYLYTNNKRKMNKKVEEQTLGIDLGWYPDGDPKGSFMLLAILNEDWDNPLLEFTSRSKAEVIETLEYWLFQEFCPSYFIDEEKFRKNIVKGGTNEAEKYTLCGAGYRKV